MLTGYDWRLGSWLLLLLEKAHLKDVFGFGVGETLLDDKGRMGRL